MHALLFTDVVDSTQLGQRLGDERAAALWEAHDGAARALLHAHRGLEIDRSDGFFLLFDTIDDAAGFALAFRAELAALGLAARFGLHVGEVRLRRTPADAVARGAKPLEVDGLAKPYAARIMSLAAGGQILISGEARAALRDPAALSLHRLGHYRLKGIADPAEIHALCAGGGADSPGTPPSDGEKAYRVVLVDGLWQPQRSVRHNLAPERDAFVGREADLQRMAERLGAGERLVTLLGPGGTGKTRLARRYARAWLGEWPGGVAFCDLSEARTREGVLFAVALALGVPLGGGDAALQLGHALAGRGRSLVILDNAEQVAAGVADLLERWLDMAPDATYVVTSRERLQLAGETVQPVEPLELTTEAVRLFELRAQAQRPDFRVDDGHRDAVAEAVRLLDGLPLAIELAAARVRVLSPAQIVQRLRDRFALLAATRHAATGAATRQATLRATIDWSWGLLDAAERSTLAQCSVFEGGFTLDSAEAVAVLPDGAPPALDVIQALVDKSLLRVMRPDAAPERRGIAEPWFGLYISIQEYAAERLAEHGGVDEAQRRHGRWMARLGDETCVEALNGPDGPMQRRVLTQEIDNLLAGCRRAIARADAPVASACYRAASEVLALRGPHGPAADLGAQVAAMEGLEGAARLATLRSLGMSLWRAARHDAAIDAWNEARSLARTLGNPRTEGLALSAMGTLHRERGRFDQAQDCCRSGLAMLEPLGRAADTAMARSNLAAVVMESGQLDEARPLFEAALAGFRQAQDRRHEGIVLGNLGNLHADQGRPGEALANYRAAIALFRDLGDLHDLAQVTSNEGTIHNEQGRSVAARERFEEALAIARSVGHRRVEGMVLNNLGILQAKLADPAAEQTMQTAAALHRSLGNRRSEAIALKNLGDLYHDQGRHEDAAASLEQSLALAREMRSDYLEAQALLSLARTWRGTSRHGEASAALARAEALLRGIDEVSHLALVLCARGLLEADAGEHDRAAATLAEVQAIAQRTGEDAGSELSRRIAELSGAVAGRA